MTYELRKRRRYKVLNNDNNYTGGVSIYLFLFYFRILREMKIRYMHQLDFYITFFFNLKCF